MYGKVTSSPIGVQGKREYGTRFKDIDLTALVRINDAKTRELWLQGVPPRCRKRVWILAIGNDLKIAKGGLMHWRENHGCSF